MHHHFRKYSGNIIIVCFHVKGSLQNCSSATFSSTRGRMTIPSYVKIKVLLPCHRLVLQWIIIHYISITIISHIFLSFQHLSFGLKLHNITTFSHNQRAFKLKAEKEKEINVFSYTSTLPTDYAQVNKQIPQEQLDSKTKHASDYLTTGTSYACYTPAIKPLHLNVLHTSNSFSGKTINRH